MNINEIQIKNFYSFQDAQISFDDYDGIVFIEGYNKDTKGGNGSGKSSILEAICWGLFGKTIRKSNEEARVNIQAGKACSVTVRVNDNVVITRSARPSSLLLEVDGGNLTKESAQVTQAEIENTLNTNYKVFTASMVLGQHANFDFLGASPEDKRIIIKNFLNLEWIFSLRDKAKKLKSNYYTDLKTARSLEEDKISSLKEITSTLEDIEKENQEIGDLDSSLSDKDISSMDNEKVSLAYKVADKKSAIKSMEKSLDRLDFKREKGVYKKVERCEYCNSESEVVQTKEDLEKIEYQILQQENIRLWMLKDVGELEDEVEKLSQSLMDFLMLMDHRDLLASKEAYEKQKLSVSGALEDHRTKKAEAAINYEVMKFWEKAFSEQGLIKFVIRNILDFFNKKCNTYLSRLTNRQFYLEFNEELHEVIATNKRSIPYISLSGGEKRKINLAVLMALQDLLSFSKKSKSNILFLDEVTENLDDKGITGLCNLLQDLKSKRKIFIITHNKELKSLFEGSDRISIIKSQGISKVKKHGNKRTK